MKITIARGEDKEKWDEWIESCDDALPYNLFAWGKAVEEAYGHKTYYLMAVDNDEVAGVLPLIYLKPPLFPGQLVSLPFCDAGDALVRNDETKKQLVLEAVVLAQRLKVKFIELRGHFQQSSLGYLNLPVNMLSHKVRMIMELPQSSEILWSNFKSKLRSQVRKSEKNGLRFDWGGPGQIEDFYKVFSRNMRDLGSPVHSKGWFEAIMMHYGENARMGLVYYDRDLAGAGIMLSINNKVSIPWASTLQKYNKLAPNMLLYWNFLKHAADSGHVQFDFGRSTPDEGTYRFKSQWGAKPFPLEWSYIILNGREMVSQSKDSAKRELIMNLWKRLPLTVANSIGPRIRKHISL